MGPSWNLRKYMDGDAAGIVELLNIAWRPRYGKWHDLDYWRWKYMNNPAGPPVIWLAEDSNKKIIGHYSVIPMVMKVGNAYVRGSFSSDAATHPEYQGKGVFSSIVNRCYFDVAQNDIPITYRFANPNLGPTYKRYERLGHICFIVQMIKLLNSELPSSKSRRSKLPSSADARRPNEIDESTSNRLEVERIDRFDQGIDRFWDEISNDFPIIVRRDHRYLNWRYVENPAKEYIIYTASRGRRIHGYCVLDELCRDNLKLGAIVDILGLQDRWNSVECLIQTALATFDEHNADAAFTTISEEHRYKALFARAGFVTYRRRHHALCASINLRGSAQDENKIFSQALVLSQNTFLKQKRNWFMMYGDGDL